MSKRVVIQKMKTFEETNDVQKKIVNQQVSRCLGNDKLRQIGFQINKINHS